MEAVRKKAAESTFAQSLYFSAGALARAVEKLAIECWKPAGITPSQGQILLLLILYTRTTGPSIIAKHLHLSPSTVTRLLDGLVKKGLVDRFTYDRTRIVSPSHKAAGMEELLCRCDWDFSMQCEKLLGKKVEPICNVLNETTDALTPNSDICHHKKITMDTSDAGRKIEPSYLEKAITYEAYIQLVDQLVAAGKTTGPDQSQAMIYFTLLNQQRMHRIGKSIMVESVEETMIRSISLPQTWLVLTEAWCGDAAQSLPVMHALAILNPLISLRLLMRDENPELMDRYLTNGVSRSIPKLIGIDTLTREELFTWGPRPAVLQEHFYQLKTEGMEYHAIKEELQRWYNKDKTLSIQREVAKVASGAAGSMVGMTA